MDNNEMNQTQTENAAGQAMNASGSSNRQSKEFIAFAVALGGAILLVLLYFLPFITIKKDYKDYYVYHKNEAIGGGSNMKVKEIINPSMLTYNQVYLTGNEDKGYAVLFTALIVISLITLLMAIKKKPIGLLIFDILTLVCFYLIVFDRMDRNIVGTDRSHYTWSISFFLYNVAFVVVLVGAIWMKRVNKKKKA